MPGMSNLEIDFAGQSNDREYLDGRTTNNEHEHQVVRPPSNAIDVPRFLFASLFMFIHSLIRISLHSVHDITQLTRDTVEYNAQQIQVLETLGKDHKTMESKINQTKKAQEELSTDLDDIQQRIDALKERRRIREARMAAATNATKK